MPRRHRRRPAGVSMSSTGGSERRERFGDVMYAVRSVTGSGSVKDYRCPGCDQLVSSGNPHIVAWPADQLAAGDRRHWHTVCWSARERRPPSRR